MGAAQVFKFGIEVWLFAVVLLLGAGPAIAVLRRWRLPSFYLLPFALAGACLLSYGLFWIVYLNARLGRAAAIACWSASVAWFLWQVWRTRRSTDSVIALLRERDAWLPIALMFLLAMSYLFILFARDAPVNYRFTWALPQDNVIPLVLADWIEDGAVDAPSFLNGDWATSDRPPLQAAVVLATRPFAPGGRERNLAYQVVSTLCELGWVPWLYAFMREVGASRRRQIYAFLGCACSGFFLINSVFTWPKLLAAWLLLLAVTLLIRTARAAPGVAPLMAVLVALSLLSHGGIAFSVVALPVVWIAWRVHSIVTVRDTAIAGLLAIVVLAPWFAYQKFVDPRGDRLLKQHLAGVEPRDPRSLSRALRDQYATLTPVEYLAGRWENVRTQWSWDVRAGDETLTDWLRRQQFFHHALALDMLCLGFIGLWFGRSAPDDRARRSLRRLVVFALATIAIWCLLMFTPGTTIVHQGSYAATVLSFVAAAGGLVDLPRPIRVAAMLVHILLFAAIWLATSQASLSRGPMSWKPAQAAGAVLGFALFVIALRAIPEPPVP